MGGMAHSPRHVLGSPDAPVTVVEYGDLECPFCRAAAPVLRALVEGSHGRIRLVWKHFPLFEVHPHALTAALAAEAAATHGLFWEMHDLLFAHQDHLTDPDLRGYAVTLGLDPAQVTGERAQVFADVVEADYVGGLAHDVRGTPTLFVNGTRYSGPIELTPLIAATRP
jgi:protein-disulfide isomerase